MLSFRFEAHNEILTIIRPFFPNGWKDIPAPALQSGGNALLKRASTALRRIGAYEDAFEASESSLNYVLDNRIYSALSSQLLALASNAHELNKLRLEGRLLDLAEAAALAAKEASLTHIWLAKFRTSSVLGNLVEAAVMWSRISPSISAFDEGALAIAQHHRALNLFLSGALTELDLQHAEEVNRTAKSALGVRNLCSLRGVWCLERGDLSGAQRSLNEAVSLARKVGKIDRRSEIRLATARIRLGDRAGLDDASATFEFEQDQSCPTRTG